MSSLREKERKKEQQDKFQAILSALLKDEDNKYCVDCDAKGPRWASWNLGLFLCIRCAGIHRNLGVHISRVKSVNLDTWTPEQVAMIQEIGNSRARAAYEANLPDGYRRPQTDSALESFIRAKYEHKKYMAREWVPPQPKVPKEWLEDKSDKKKAKPKQPSAVKLSSVPKSTSPVEASKPQQPVQKTEVILQNTEAKVNSLADDLLGLDLAPPQTNVQQPPSAQAPSSGNDLLELFGGPQQAGQNNSAPSSVAAPIPQASNQTNSAVNGSASETNLFGEDTDAGEKKTSTKDSIMALFGGSSSQPQMYGVPGADGQFYNVPYYGGMYIPQNQQGFPGGAMPQQGMMAQQNQGMMGQQQQGMMGQQNQAMMGQQTQGMMGQQTQGMMGQQQNQGMMGQQTPGMMGPQGMMGQNQGMMGPQQNIMGGQMGMMGHQQAGMMGQQPAGMMGNAMMNGAQQPGMFQGQGQMMMGNTNMYAPQPMQQLQFQQTQQPMGKPANNWGNPSGQTLSNNLWQ